MLAFLGAADYHRMMRKLKRADTPGILTMLRSVLAARPAAVARTRGQMDAALHAIEAQEHPLPAANALAERAVQSLCADNLASIEVTMDAVGSALRDDPATAAIVAQMLVPSSRYSGTRIESNA